MTSKCAVMRGDAAKAPCLRSSPLMEGLWADDEKAATRSIYDQCLEVCAAAVPLCLTVPAPVPVAPLICSGTWGQGWGRAVTP